MRATDIAGLCVQNLKRRRARTFLTALGVMVGCCAIVIMVSIGFGLSEQTKLTLAQMGDLTLITVSAPQKSSSTSVSGTASGAAKLDDEVERQIEDVPHVKSATPKLDLASATVKLTAGVGDRYTCDWSTIVGMDMRTLDDAGYKIVEGTGVAPASSTLTAQLDGPIDVLVGQWTAYDFADSYLPEGSNTVDRYSSMYDEMGNLNADGPSVAPYFDILQTPITLTITTNDDSVVGSYQLVPKGRLSEDYARGYETSSGIAMDTTFVKALNELIGGVPSSSTSYSSLLVKVDDIANVADVEAQITALGYNTSSMESIRKPMEQQAAQQQLMLGGLGAISLLVAALGITNTMVMSISERTREIGIMKALGCFVVDIKRLFLSEAASIGLLGGVAGCIVSFIISLCMNVATLGGVSPENLGTALFGSDGVARMSVIPWWLYLFAVAFAMVVGLASGYYPARRAVRISAIEAIKSE